MVIDNLVVSYSTMQPTEQPNLVELQHVNCGMHCSHTLFIMMWPQRQSPTAARLVSFPVTVYTLIHTQSHMHAHVQHT